MGACIKEDSKLVLFASGVKIKFVQMYKSMKSDKYMFQASPPSSAGIKVSVYVNAKEYAKKN
jgi:hypothetical protein